jgi:hypothetical protein
MFFLTPSVGEPPPPSASSRSPLPRSRLRLSPRGCHGGFTTRARTLAHARGAEAGGCACRRAAIISHQRCNIWAIGKPLNHGDWHTVRTADGNAVVCCALRLVFTRPLLPAAVCAVLCVSRRKVVYMPCSAGMRVREQRPQSTVTVQVPEKGGGGGGGSFLDRPVVFR